MGARTSRVQSRCGAPRRRCRWRPSSSPRPRGIAVIGDPVRATAVKRALAAQLLLAAPPGELRIIGPLSEEDRWVERLPHRRSAEGTALALVAPGQAVPPDAEIAIIRAEPSSPLPTGCGAVLTISSLTHARLDCGGGERELRVEAISAVQAERDRGAARRAGTGPPGRCDRRGGADRARGAAVGGRGVGRPVCGRGARCRGRPRGRRRGRSRSRGRRPARRRGRGDRIRQERAPGHLGALALLDLLDERGELPAGGLQGRHRLRRSGGTAPCDRGHHRSRRRRFATGHREPARRGALAGSGAVACRRPRHPGLARRRCRDS